MCFVDDEDAVAAGEVFDDEVGQFVLRPAAGDITVTADGIS
jgi:hypothetical protein